MPLYAFGFIVAFCFAAAVGCAQHDITKPVAYPLGQRTNPTTAPQEPNTSRAGSMTTKPSAASQTYDPAEFGPHQLLQLEFTNCVDSKRNDRRLATRITAPKGKNAFPLVIMSHGLGGNWSSHQAIVDHIASHGYIVFAPNHPASDTRRVFHKKKDYAQGDRAALDPAAVLGRGPDVSFLVDQAEKWNVDPKHPFHSRIQVDKIAVAGHSFGAFTAFVTCGARPILDHLDPPVPPGSGLAPSMRDPRVDVGIAYSPQGPGGGFYSDESFAEMKCPMLIFSGSRDRQAKHIGRGTLPPETRYRTFELIPEGDKYYMWLYNAGHMGWADMNEASGLVRVAGKLTTPEAGDVTRISSAMSVAFLDAYLRGNEAARSKLTDEYAQSLTGRVVRRIRWSQK